MNRKNRRASGVKGKKGDDAVMQDALKLARQLVDKKHDAEAEKLYRRILDFNPDNVSALLDWGVECYKKGALAEAETMFGKVLRLDKNNIGGLIMLATLRMDQNRVAEAMELVAKAVAQNPSKQVMTRIGILYRDAGQLDRARECIKAAIAHNPNDISAYYTLQTLKKFSPEERDAMDRLSKAPDIKLQEKTIVEFALGKACMDLGDTDRAFWHFAEANMLKRATYKYAMLLTEKYFDGLQKLFDDSFLARLRGAVTNKGGNNIFIVGMPRSGSTLVDQIISSHPQVVGVGESRFMSYSLPVYRNTEVPDYFPPDMPSYTRKFMDEMDKEMLEQIGDKYIAQTKPFTKERKIVVDKMLFNFSHLGAILLALPDAKIIHCVRDPVDIGLSIWQLFFSDEIPWAYDQAEIGRYILAYQKLMEYWKKAFPGKILDVHYEDVVADQEGQSRRLLDFCGLPWDERVLRFHENARQVKTASVTQVRQPIYKDSVRKWKKYEKHLQKLITALGPENTGGGAPPG